MLDALAELKKYHSINLDIPGPLPADPVANLLVVKIADDINRIAKNLFRLEQQFENHAEEILDRCNQEFGKDALLLELRVRLEETGAKEARLVQALVDLADALDTVRDFIDASGDSDWIAQMGEVRQATLSILMDNGLLELGPEKYFTESLHEAISAVQDEQREHLEIVEMARKGYSYQGRVLRKAQVAVNTWRKDSEDNE